MDYHLHGNRLPLLVILIYGGLAVLGIFMVYLNSMGNTHETSVTQTFSMYNSMDVTTLLSTHHQSRMKTCHFLLNQTDNITAQEHTKPGRSQLESLKFMDHISTPDILDLTRHCHNYVINREYPQDPTSPEEEQFPIAYSITVNKGAEDFERTLRSLYHVQNIYCVRLGEVQDSATEFVVNRIALCFENVFLIGKSTDYGRLESEFGCTRDLFEKHGWKYHINVDDAMFPVKTNWEMVKILKTLNGSGIIHLKRPRRVFESRVDHRVSAFLRERDKMATVLFSILSRDCMDSITGSKEALQFLNLLKDDQGSDGYFLLLKPRHFNSEAQDVSLIPGFWIQMAANKSGFIEHSPQGSLIVRDTCPNMTQLFDKEVFFLSMFSLENCQELYTCLRCFLFRRTQDYVEGKRKLNVMYYYNLGRKRS